MYKDLFPIKNSDLSFIILTFEKPPAALQPINCMCYTSCKHACTFERMGYPSEYTEALKTASIISRGTMAVQS